LEDINEYRCGQKIVARKREELVLFDLPQYRINVIVSSPGIIVTNGDFNTPEMTRILSKISSNFDPVGAILS
jgi:hypothetical protein